MILPDWEGETVAVVASGESTPEILSLVRSRCRLAVVNLNFRLAPEAEILYAADSGFWQHYKDSRNFQGMKISAHVASPKYDPNVHVATIPKKRGRRVDRMLEGPPGTIGAGGGNSGFQLINLVAQTRPRRILLVGYDYGGGHWHEDHPAALRNPTPRQLGQWRQFLDDEAATLRAWGIEVLNLSRRSSLRRFERAESDILTKIEA